MTSQSTRTGEPAHEPAPEPLWTPSEARIARSRLTGYRRWLTETRGLGFPGYQELWEWSVTDLDAFWRSVWEFFEVGDGEAPSPALAERRMPGSRWFPGARLNHAELALRRRDGHSAIVAGSEDGSLRTITRLELAGMVAAAVDGLRRLGVGSGDRVVAYLPNVPETVVAFLATASIGAIWSSCAPEFGVSSVVDRFQQIEPTVLLAVEGYRYGGRWHDRRGEVSAIRSQLPTLRATVLVPAPGQDAASGEDPAGEGPGPTGAETLSWADLLRTAGADGPQRPRLTFEPVPFDHPLWILYSSGTTGLPKPIVQGHGGIVLEHLKSLGLHLDLGPGDRFFWFTTTGWMMWNMLISGLLLGSTVVLYDGSPAYPDMGALWRLAEEAGMTYFGASAPYIQSCRKAGIQPGRDFDLSRLKAIGSTGAPLPPEGFGWVYDAVSSDLLLGSVSTQCARHSPGCVVVVPEDFAPSETPRIVVGADGSAGAEPALRFAFDEAVARGATLSVVRAWQPPRLADPAEVEGTELQLLRESVAPWRERYPAVIVEPQLVADHPARALAAAAEGARLLAVGARGQGGFGGLRLGSVSLQVLHHARVPVAVVHPHHHE